MPIKLTTRHSGYALIVAIFFSSFVLFITIQFLNAYQQQMYMLHHFRQHEEARLVYQVALPVYQEDGREDVKTNLGTAKFSKKEVLVFCEVKLKKDNYQETFSYVYRLPDHPNS